MSLVKVVIDTNGILRCISSRSSFAVILDKLKANEFELIVSTDVLLEYEEKIAEIFSPEVAELILGAFVLLPNVTKVDIHFSLNLISGDKDDNKFADCAFAGNAHFIVTDDKHFNVLKDIAWPRLEVISLSAFKDLFSPPPFTEELTTQLV